MFNIILCDYKKNYAFDGCTNLVNIEIPASVTTIEDYAFDECPSLSTVNYMGTIEQWNQINIDNLMNDFFFHCFFPFVFGARFLGSSSKS